MTLIKNSINWILYIAYLIFFVVILLEVIFRILPTASPVALRPTIDKNDILRMIPNKKTTYSIGKNFNQVIQKSTNNYGFYSSFDYFPNSKPDLAIIGDSYVEALHVRSQDSMGEILNKLAPGLTVYQLGVSGVPLSQYIQMIRYAQKEFSPQHFVVVVGGNDFDESLCSFRIKEGTWCFNSENELVFTPFFGYSLIRKIARNSAFMRYAIFNAGLDWRRLISDFGMSDPGLKTENQYSGNTEIIKPAQVIRASHEIISKFFTEIINLGLENKITLVIDADRQDIYQNKSSESYFNNMRRFMIEIATKKNISIIDMEVIFGNDYDKYNKKFEFPNDPHWNERAHKLAAKALLNKL